MMDDAPKNGILPVQTLRNNIMASTVLALTAIMLCFLIALLMTISTRRAFFVFENRSEFAYSIKFFAILVCFLVAFLFNVQSIRYYSHASMLINASFKKMMSPPHHKQQYLTQEYVATTVNRGSYCWSLGLRAFYFSFLLFLWIFGPISMFLSCIVLVILLYFLDFTFLSIAAATTEYFTFLVTVRSHIAAAILFLHPLSCSFYLIRHPHGKG
ncbi:hypothetical protein PS2_011539 [Malus domestica]